MRRALVISLLALCACGALSVPKTDSGMLITGRDGAIVDGGQTHPGDAATTVVDAGGERVDAGPQFRWSQYSFDATPPTPPIAFRVVGLTQRDGGELWVALGDSLVYRALPGEFVLKRVGLFSTSTAGDVVGLFSTSREVFVVREDRMLSCSSPCATFADFTPVFTFPSTTEGAAGCGSAERAYVVSRLGGTTALHLKTGVGVFQEVTASLPTTFGFSCTAFGDSVFVVGTSAIAIRSGSGAISSESITADHGVSWRSVAVTPTGGVVVGFGQGGEVARRSGSTWASLTALPFANDLLGFSTVLALGDDSFLLAGAPSTAQRGSPLYETKGASFAPLKTPLPSVTIDRGLAIGPDELVVAGSLSGFGSYFIARGVRE